MKRCKICGKEKPLEDFSKSYPTRCKECVNKETRAKRLLEKEEYKPKLTIPIPPIDWEQRRYEIAKNIMPAIIQNLYHQLEAPQCKWSKLAAERAVECADALIEELKNQVS